MAFCGDFYLDILNKSSNVLIILTVQISQKLSIFHIKKNNSLENYTGKTSRLWFVALIDSKMLGIFFATS